MRNAEAARYARWAGMAALSIVALAAGAYGYRALRRARAMLHAPLPVSAAIQKQSAEFAFSKVEQDRTIFTIKASRATQFKGQDRSLLEDVAITVYGTDGSRNDSIHTRACSYEPQAGGIRCQGAAEIRLESAQDAQGGKDSGAVRVETQDISFNGKSGIAKTTEPVFFHFPGGDGQAVGVLYDANEARVQLMERVEVRVQRPGGTFAVPVTLTGTNLEYRRRENRLRLSGPVKAVQGTRELTADGLTIILDAALHPQSLIAEGHVGLQLTGPEALVPTAHGAADRSGRDVRETFAARRVEAQWNPSGWIEEVIAEGEIRAGRENASGKESLAAQRVEMKFVPRANEPDKITVDGGVEIESQGSGGSQSLTTPALVAHFRAGRPRTLSDAQTLAPATYMSRTSRDQTEINGQTLDAEFGSDGHLEKVLGHSGVRIRRIAGSGAPQVITADELSVALASGGDWSVLDLQNHVRFRQDDRTAEAQSAEFVRATDLITLSGSPALADSSGRAAAAAITINQRTGEIRGTGGIRSDFSGKERSGGPEMGSGPAFLSADSFSGNAQSGDITYSGHARLWQGDSVLDADAIEIWRNQQRLEARGNVTAVFAEAPSQQHEGAKPVLWKVTAPLLRYSNPDGHVHLEQGVRGTSEAGELTSQGVDMYLSPGKAGAARRRMERAVATGGVMIRQGDRRGTGGRAEYTVADGKVVLTGGQPTLTDASGNSSTGDSLTFFLANDTILVDSQRDTRTLTTHRIEK